MGNLSTVKQRVYQAVIDIHNSGHVAMRKSIADLLGLKFSVVDEHIKSLKDEGLIRAVGNGVFEPCEVFGPNRPVSKTVLQDGKVVIEVGDDELRMTPGEARIVGLALHGDAMEIAHLRGQREVYDTVQTLKNALRATERKLSQVMSNVAELEQKRRQDDLFAQGATT